MSSKSKDIMKDVRKAEKRATRAADAAKHAGQEKARKKAAKIRKQKEEAVRRLAEEKKAAAERAAYFASWSKFTAEEKEAARFASFWEAHFASNEMFGAGLKSMREKTLAILGLTTAQDNPTAIRSAHRRLALKWHPDKNPHTDTTEIFRGIQAAYEILDAYWTSCARAGAGTA